MDLGLAGKRALVMGASSGIGYAIAAAFAAEGARVAIAARGHERLEAAAARIGARPLEADLAKSGAAADLVRRSESALGGGIDLLVANTGGPKKAAFTSLTDADWRAAFESLWLSATESMRAALPGMRARRFGRVLLVASVSAREPIPELTLSNALRAGLVGLVHSVAREVAADGVTVNAILPGFTATERLLELGIPEAEITKDIPARRLGRPEELGALAAFLASTHAAYLTGQSIAVDGGWLRGA